MDLSYPEQNDAKEICQVIFAQVLSEADQCGGDGGGVGPQLRGGPALAASPGASGGGPGWGQDPHLPAPQEGAAGPATLEGIAPSYQEEKVHGVTGMIYIRLIA